MVTSRTVVHPLEVAAPPPPEGQLQQPQPEPEPEQGVVDHPPDGVVMRYIPGMPGTPVALVLRIAQMVLAGISLAAMCFSRGFWSVEAFRYALPRPQFPFSLRPF